MGRSDAEIARAIDISMEVFKREGYERTGIESLVEATGLNRYAIYQQFGGKRELFLAALDRDNDLMLQNLRDMMRNRTNSALDTLKSYLESPLKDLVESIESEFAGSMVCQAAFELAPRDDVVAESVDKYMQKKLTALTEVFEEAEADGSLRPGIKPADAAQLTMTTMYALTALSQCPKGQLNIEIAMNSTFAILCANTN